MSTTEAERLAALIALLQSGRALQIREKAGLPTTVVARSAGTSQSTIWRWERCQRTPTAGPAADSYLTLLRRLAKAQEAS